MLFLDERQRNELLLSVRVQLGEWSRTL